MGQMGFDATTRCGSTATWAHPPCAHAGQQLRDRGRRRADVDRLQARARLEPTAPRARIVATAVTQHRPDHHAHRPRAGHSQALAKSRLRVEDIDLFEVNEAFASVVLKFIRTWASAPHRSMSAAAPSWATLGATGCAILGTRRAGGAPCPLRPGHLVGGGMGDRHHYRTPLSLRDLTDAIRYEKARTRSWLTLMPGQSANTMNAAYREAMAATLTRLEAEKTKIAGVVLGQENLLPAATSMSAGPGDKTHAKAFYDVCCY